MKRPVVIDFETRAIDDRRGDLAPEPVGLGIWEPGRRPEYLAWGHPEGNNCTRAEARNRLQAVWRSGRRLLFHGAEFDLSVAEQHFGLRWLPEDRYECTRILSFLRAPDSKQVDLKKVAQDLCGIAPDERDELQAWVLENILAARKSTWGAYLAEAPAGLVGRYCKADLRMTLEVWQASRWVANAMPRAYAREKRALEVVQRASEVGIPLDVPAVESFHREAPAMESRLDTALRRRLGAPGLDMQDREAVADAMEDAGLIEEWLLTQKTEKRSLSHKDLHLTCLDPRFVELWHARSLLRTYDRTFARNWLAMEVDGRIHPRWNTVATESGGGARTGRASSNPNVQNIAKKLPMQIFADLTLPDLRSMIRAARGMLLVGADFGQQEMRLLGHFENGRFAEAIRKDPNAKIHVLIQQLLRSFGVLLTYDQTKTAGFALLYGQGGPATAVQMGVDLPRAREIMRAYKTKAVPGIAIVDQYLRECARNGEAFETWGGRQYRCEEPIRSWDGVVIRSFEYKMINTLIQGSAADHLKESMIAYYDHPRRIGDLILNAHDEIVSHCPRKAAAYERRVLEESMMSVGPFHVPMIAEAEMGRTWREAKAA